MRIMTRSTRSIAVAPNSYSFLGDGKRIMASTLTWLMQAEGAGAGGFFAAHPATGDRIQRARAKPRYMTRRETS